MSTKLYPFRYRDPLTGKWVRARYVAEPHEIAERYAEWKITGPAEIRKPIGGYFHPFRNPAPRTVVDVNAQLIEPAAVDPGEAWYVRLFLRRYVTWCARRRRFDRATRAAMLWRGISAAPVGGEFVV